MTTTTTTLKLGIRHPTSLHVHRLRLTWTPTTRWLLHRSVQLCYTFVFLFFVFCFFVCVCLFVCLFLSVIRTEDSDLTNTLHWIDLSFVFYSSFHWSIDILHLFCPMIWPTDDPTYPSILFIMNGVIKQASKQFCSSKYLTECDCQRNRNKRKGRMGERKCAYSLM